MKKLTSIITILACLGICSAVMAEQPAVALSKVYVGGAIGYADTGWSNYDSTGIGLSLSGGYHYNEYWSFEGTYTHFPTATAASNIKVHTNTVGAFAKIHLPVNASNLNFYAKLGFADTMQSGANSDSHIGLGMGYGFDYTLQRGLELQAQYTHYVGKYTTSTTVPNIDFYSVGLLYRLPKNFMQKLKATV
jgi:hypothetical protein